MTTVSNTAVPAAVRPPAPAAAAPAMQGMGVDPMKLLQRNKWTLLVAGAAGLGLGLAAHIFFMRFYPIYKPHAVFECYPPESSAWTLPGGSGSTNNEEVATFMQTQVRIMTSEEILQKVAELPKLREVAPKYTARFQNRDGTYDTSKLGKYLGEDVTAKVVTQTRLIDLSFGWTSPSEAAGVVKLVMDEYMDTVARLNDDQFKSRTSAHSKNIEDAKREIQLLQARQATIIRDNNVDSVDQRLTEANIRLELVNRRITEVSGQLEDVETRIRIREAQKTNETGVPIIPDEIKSRVSRDPFIVALQQDITAMQTQIQALKGKGVQPAHRQLQALVSRHDAAKGELEAKQQELWTQEFESELNEMKNMRESLKSQLEQSTDEAGKLRGRQTTLAQVLTDLDDIRDKIRQQQVAVQSSSEKLRELNAIMAQPTAVRILARQRDVREPKEPVFPRLVFMVPAGALLSLGAVGGFIVLREVVDQRLKGPGDVSLIPRTRLLGWVADAGEDPAGPGVVETAFRDRPRGLLAENFRQIRSSLHKKMEVAGHRAVVVVGCMPSSGATSIAANLALASAASGKKVLLIDANFRRPALHRVFGVPEGPGLGEVLAGEAPIASAAAAIKDNPNLRVLTAGAANRRVYESLATESFGRVLSEARGLYDCVYVDVAPAVVSGDAVAIANRCDASILVARTMSEKRGMIARIKNELSEARGEFLGVIVNGVKSSAGGYLKGNIKATHDYQNEAEAHRERPDRSVPAPPRARHRRVGVHRRPPRAPPARPRR
jgi:capsular exopolysaccharide synthesis family protein